MAVELLTTKLFVPTPPAKLVVRERLFGELDQGLLPPSRVLALIAPAGFGKTTVLTSWITQRHLPATWLGLAEDDNDPHQFWAYLLAALQTRHPELGKDFLFALHSAQPPSLRPHLTTLLNQLATLATPLLLVLDDYHFVTNSAIHEDLAFWLEHLPAQMTVAITSRSDLPLPMARWRAKGLLTEVRVTQLRFDLPEIAEFLAQNSDLYLTAQQLSALDQRTEGWVTALQLLVLSLRRRSVASDIHNFLTAFTGSHRYIVSYLLDEVLAHQPQAIQDFLHQTSILSQLSAPVCQAVTGQVDTQGILDYLVEHNLFTLPLDDESIWYRYHHLFAEMLQHRLHQQQQVRVPLLHQRAGDWYASQDQPAQALHHYLQAHNHDAAAVIVIGHYRSLLGRGEIATLRSWLAQLPPEIIASNLYLCLAHAWVLVQTSQADGIPAAIAQAQAALDQADLPPATRRLRQAEVDALQIQAAVSAQDFARAILLGEASVNLPPEAVEPVQANLHNSIGVTLALKLHALGVAYRMLGQLSQAKQNFQQCKHLAFANQDLLLGLYALTNETAIREVQGELAQAHHQQEEALRLLARHGVAQTPLGSLIYLNLGKLQREFGQLTTAAESLHHALTLAQAGGLEGIVVDSTITQALVAMGQRDFATAHAHLDTAAAIVQHWSESDVPLRLSAFRTRIWLAEGCHEQAVAWLEVHQEQIDRFEDEWHEIEQLSAARVQITMDAAAALARLEAALKRAQAGQRQGRVVEILALQALAQAVLGNLDAAQGTLAQALTLAHSQVQLFVDEGTPMRDLLATLVDQPVPAGERARRLLSAFTTSGKPTTLQPSATANSLPIVAQTQLLEPLSARELEVLALISEGLTDQEIADKLIISRRTVKKHNENIYGKLAVANRTQAAARARELGLA